MSTPQKLRNRVDITRASRKCPRTATFCPTRSLQPFYYRPGSATCRRPRMWPHAPAKRWPLKDGNLPSCGYFDAKLIEARKQIPRVGRGWSQSPCCCRLKARLSLSTAPPSCCSTWSAARPGSDTWSRSWKEHRPEIRLQALLPQKRIRRRLEIRTQICFRYCLSFSLNKLGFS